MFVHAWNAKACVWAKFDKIGSINPAQFNAQVSLIETVDVLRPFFEDTSIYNLYDLSLSEQNTSQFQ